jgi:hypothetical protein
MKQIGILLILVLQYSCQKENSALINEYFFNCTDFENSDFAKIDAVSEDCISVIIEDNFNSPDNWNFTSTELSISESKLKFDVKSDGWCLRLSNADGKVSKFIDYNISINKNAVGNVGLYFESKDCSNRNVFTYKTNTVILSRVFDNKSTTLFTKTIPSFTGNIILKVRKIDSTYYVFADNEFITSLKNIESFGSECGIYLGSNSKGSIDYIKINSIF